MKSADAAKTTTLVPFRRAYGAAEREFLPAALEIIETPASPLGRAIGGTIILFFVIAIAWACIGRIDIVATASGKIVPSGRTKVVQPFETGVVGAIHVQDGQAVSAGEVLVELDPTIDDAERDRFSKEMIAAQLDVARLSAVLSAVAGGPASFAPLRGRYRGRSSCSAR
jgi:hemolysin D